MKGIQHERQTITMESYISQRHSNSNMGDTLFIGVDCEAVCMTVSGVNAVEPLLYDTSVAIENTDKEDACIATPVFGICDTGRTYEEQ